MGRRVKCTIPFVDAYRDRHGKPRYYFRRNRKSKRVKLPGEPGSREFIAAYDAAMKGAPARVTPPEPKDGTLDKLRELYYASAEFKNLAESTRRETRYVIDALCATPNKSGGKRGDNPVNKIEPRHVYAWRDKLADKPGAANKMIRTVKAFLSFGVRRQFIKENPAFGIKDLKIGRWRSWRDWEMDAFEKRWPLGTLERTGYALALYTVQRRSDLVAIAKPKTGATALHVRQQKTGTDLVLQIHPDLQAALDAVKDRPGETVLTGASGNALNPVYFGHIMAAAIESAGLPDDCVLHGLRKTGARIIAETGGRVRSMTGHLSAQMEREYERDAEQKQMSEVAVLNWSRRRKNKT